MPDQGQRHEGQRDEGQQARVIDLTAAQAAASGELPRSVLVLNWRDTGHPEGGGSEVYVEHMASGLAAAGVAVTVFCARYPGSAAREVRDGVRIVRRGGRFTLYVWAALLYLARRLGRPDVVVEVQNGMPFLASWWCRRPVVVLVHHVHREQWRVVLPRPLAALGWWLESSVAPRANRRQTYVTVSQATRDELVGLGVRPQQVHVVHNGTAPAPTTATGHARSRAARPTVAVVGRLVPHKRVELAMHAVAELAVTVPDVHLDVVGSGWWSARLARHARALGIDDRTTFHGHVDESTKHDLLASAWVLAVPSLKEGWGLVVVEAAAHGTPTVAFRSAGGLRESVHDAVGGLLADDYAGFVDALRRVVTDDDLRARLGAGARVHAFTFSWPGSVQAFAALLGAAVAGRSGGGHPTVGDTDATQDPAREEEKERLGATG
jgi:glycosyltransferase involved in cell wall biosynthesis